MSKMFWLVAMVCVFSLSSFASETIKGAKKDLETFKQEMSVELEKAEKNLKVMSEKADRTSSAMYRQTVKDMTEKRDQLRTKLNNLHADSKGEWKEAKAKISSGLNSLNDRIQKTLND